jgi:antitoxin component YwqK of YwqJK toxin-antitoxin module
MKILSVPFVLLLTLSLHAQYYYNDIVATLETNQQMKNWLTNKVKSFTAAGFDSRGTRASDFSEYYEVAANGNTSIKTSISNLNKTITTTHFDEKNRVISIADSLSAIDNLTTITYDNNNRIAQIINTVKDSSNDFNQVETHQWIYSTNNKPEKMWRIIENTGAMSGIDTLEVRFVFDDDGNIAEERTYKKNTENNFLYYYYDNKNRLTDIVRYNNMLKKLIPEIMFEYDEKDRVIQKITTTSDRVVGYLIWRYIYDEKGLKTKEVLFNNDKQLTGKIEYTYSFYQ